MEPWSFIHVADMQPGSPRSFRYAPSWAENWRVAMEQIREYRPDLVLVGGDLTRDGSLHDFEFAEIKSDLATLATPYHVIPGNMDTGNKHAPCQGARDDRNDLDLNVTAGQISRFTKYFGPAHWTFVHKNVRFTGFYAAVAGSGLAEETEMWKMLEDLARSPVADHHVVITHYPLFFDSVDDPTFDLRKADEYLPWYFSIDKEHRMRLIELMKRAGVELAISGHIHCAKTNLVDGIKYIKAPATSMSQMADHWSDGDGTLGFLRFRVTDESIDEHFVPLRRISTAKGYGPGGHPKPEQRDYSRAWQKPTSSGSRPGKNR